jgi:kynureninase
MINYLKYAVESQIRLHGYDPEDALICVKPRRGEHTLRDEDILAAIKEHGQSIALVLFSGVQYYTGQLFDMQSITRAAHEQVRITQ